MLVSTGALPSLGATQTTPPSISSIALSKVEYWHKDHLGSLVSTTDQNGAVTARYEYDPFGKRRTASGQYDASGNVVVDWSNTTNNGDQRGYTGHEQLDDIGIIHMNGRIYDPMLGHFMQPDPLIQDPTNLQNFNRYGYCYNNPMTCTDPSGNEGNLTGDPWNGGDFGGGGWTFGFNFSGGSGRSGGSGNTRGGTHQSSMPIPYQVVTTGYGTPNFGANFSANFVQISTLKADVLGSPVRAPKEGGVVEKVTSAIGNGLTAVNDFVTSPAVVNGEAGFGDSLSFGLTGYYREWRNIGDVDKNSDAYNNGEKIELAFEVSTMGVSAGLKMLAKDASREATRNATRPLLNKFREENQLKGGFVHHSNPLFGHPGGKGTMFPTGGLPAWLNSGSWNLKWFATSGSHAAEHRWMKSLERTWQSIVN